MCCKVLKKDSTDMLLSQESTTEELTKEIDTIVSYQLGLRHGQHPICPLYMLTLCQ